MFKLVHTRTPKFWVTNSTRGKTCKWKNISSSLRYTSLHFMFRFFSRSAALSLTHFQQFYSLVYVSFLLSFHLFPFLFFSFLFRANRILLPTTSSLHTATMITVWVPNVYTHVKDYIFVVSLMNVYHSLWLCVVLSAELSWAELHCAFRQYIAFGTHSHSHTQT